MVGVGVVVMVSLLPLGIKSGGDFGEVMVVLAVVSDGRSKRQ